MAAFEWYKRKAVELARERVVLAHAVIAFVAVLVGFFRLKVTIIAFKVGAEHGRELGAVLAIHTPTKGRLVVGRVVFAVVAAASAVINGNTGKLRLQIAIRFHVIKHVDQRLHECFDAGAVPYAKAVEEFGHHTASRSSDFWTGWLSLSGEATIIMNCSL